MNEINQKVHEKLCFCNICENRSYIRQEKTICGLTGSFASFKNECPNFIFDQDEFLTLEKKVKDDIINTNEKLRNNIDYYNDEKWELYKYDKNEYRIQYIKLPQEYDIKAPILKNIFFASIVFLFSFLLSYVNIDSFSLNPFWEIVLSVFIGLVPAILLYYYLIRKVAEIVLNSNGIRFHGSEVIEVKWNEVLFFFVKELYQKSKGGIDVSRYLKINYISGYSEIIETEDFLTDSKSSELLSWASKYHKKYWSQFFTKKT